MTSQKPYRVLYFVGPQIELSTKMLSGKAELKDGCLKLTGIDTLLIPLTEIRDPHMYRMHGLGRMIRFGWKEKTVFITVVRINFFGYFAIINFFRTGHFFKALSLSAASA